MADEKQTIKIVTLSAEGCKPCKDLQQEIDELSGKYDIDLVIVEANKSHNLEPNAIPEAFGKVDVVPTTIIETAERSEKLVGYTEGELEKVIKEVLGEGEDVKDNNNLSEMQN